MRRQRALIAVLSAASFAACVCGGVIDDEEGPVQFRDPKAFWMHKVVFQKRGIVIEDEDFIVRNAYWVLTPSAQGQVVGVEQVDRSGVFVEVRFDETNAGWNRHGINIRNRAMENRHRTVRIRPDPYGDGAEIEADEVTYSYTIEGVEVERSRCGLIIRREGDVTVVRFPCHLVALVSPLPGDTVQRSGDWQDGYSDGGRKPRGPHEGSANDCIGRVLSERDREGFVSVRWEKTGRKKLHRFDHLGYYDIEVVH